MTEFSDRAGTLGWIEIKAGHIRHDAERTAFYVRRLADLPDYETKAEDTVKLAELALTEALLVVKLAKAELARKRATPSLVAAE